MMMRAERWLLILSTITASAFALWNLNDEVRPKWDGAGVFVFCNWAAWTLVPALNVVIGMRTPESWRLHTSVVLALLFAYFYGIYAFNGSTVNRQDQGAPQMHIILVPILSVLLAAFVHAVGGATVAVQRMIQALVTRAPGADA